MTKVLWCSFPALCWFVALKFLARINSEHVALCIAVLVAVQIWRIPNRGRTIEVSEDSFPSNIWKCMELNLKPVLSVLHRVVYRGDDVIRNNQYMLSIDILFCICLC